MEGADLEVSDLLVEEAKAAYLLDEHNIRVLEIAEVHRNRPRYFVRNAGLRTFNMVGQTFDGRWMVVSIQHLNGSVFRVVTAFWNSDGRAEKLYRGSQ